MIYYTFVYFNKEMFDALVIYFNYVISTYCKKRKKIGKFAHLFCNYFTEYFWNISFKNLFHVFF